MDDSTVTTHPLVDVIKGVVRDHNRMWSEGALAPDSSIRHVTDDLTAVQYAPHYDDGVWTARSGAEWVDGSAQAAAAMRGQGCTWSLHDLGVLARGEDEAIASYRVVHHWGAPDRPPAQAFFLETWRRDAAGCWRLARHTAEKT